MNNLSIEFEAPELDCVPAMQWHYGTVKQNGKEYPVTVCEMYESNSGTSSFEVTWVEETPENSVELETLILEKFE